MKKTALVFFAHNPVPPKTGAHKRCLEMLATVRMLGFRTTFLSSHRTSEAEWNQASIDTLLAKYVDTVHVYEDRRIDRWHLDLLKRYYWRFNLKPPINSSLQSPLGMRWWFRSLYRKTKPDLVLMNYAYWDGLIDHRKLRDSVRFMDSLDLVSLNGARYIQVVKTLAQVDQIDSIACTAAVLQEDFFETGTFGVDPMELKIYDQYDCTIAISDDEADIIRRGTKRTRVELLKMSHDVVQVDNSYSDEALYTTGPNIFNVQGYLYFVKRVLPLVLDIDPSFRLTVTGYVGSKVKVKDRTGIELLGFVPSLKPYYERARFAICPVFGGTGQQIKIVEAMAHGLAVVALSAAAKASPIKHGVNGLVAENADAFARCIIDLWQDPDLCSRLGSAARETISNECSREQNVAAFKMILKAHGSID